MRLLQVFCCCFLMLANVLRSYAEENVANQYVQGTVASVQKSRAESPEYTIGGSNPTDAPLTSRYYVFDIAIRVGCVTYIGRYPTAFNYLSSLFTPGHNVELRLTKHAMYFVLPNDPDFKIGIVHRKKECGTDR